MQRKTGIVLGVIGLLLILICCLAGIFVFIRAGLQVSERVTMRQAELDKIRPSIGTQPPGFSDAKMALPSQVGVYILSEDTVWSFDDFYGFHVDDDTSAGIYSGPDGEVELMIVHTRSHEGAINYVGIFQNWVHNNHLASYNAIINDEDKRMVLYSIEPDDSEDPPERHGRIWASQEWVIKIEADTYVASDDFFEALPYR